MPTNITGPGAPPLVSVPEAAVDTPVEANTPTTADTATAPADRSRDVFQEVPENTGVNQTARVGRLVNDVHYFVGKLRSVEGAIATGLTQDQAAILEGLGKVKTNPREVEAVFELAKETAARKAARSLMLRGAHTPGQLQVGAIKALEAGAKAAQKEVARLLPKAAAVKLGEGIAQSVSASALLHDTVTALPRSAWLTRLVPAIGGTIMAYDLSKAASTMHDKSSTTTQVVAAWTTVVADGLSFVPVPWVALGASGVSLVASAFRDSKAPGDALLAMGKQVHDLVMPTN